MDVQPQHHPPVPSVPSIPADAANHGLRARRRSSLPPMPTDSRTQKRSPNYIRTHAASPEIISSLIDQLSAISISAQNHFENLPTGYGNSVSSPASPALPPPSFGRDSFGFRDGSSGDHSSQYSSVKDLNHLYSDDACEPPVIRTSKPPSGFSPLTAPKKREKEHSLRSYIGRSGGSSCSIHSAHSGRSVSSFGNISIEAGVQRQVSNGSARSSVESKRSAKGHRSLMYMSSRERLRLKDAERKRSTIQGPEVLSIHDTPRKAPIQLSVSEDTIKEEPITKDEPVVAESSRAGQRWPSRGTSPLRKGLNLLNGASSSTGSPTDHGLIPERGSSLRHSGSPSRRGKKGHSRRGSRNETHTTTNTVPEEEEEEEEETMDPEALLKEKILRQLEQEDDEVAQRIRELKKQKLLRDKLAGKLPAGVDAGASSSPAPVSPLSSPEPSPTSTVSTMSEKRTQDPSKAHKVLGIVAQSSPPEKDVTSQPEPKVHVETPKSRHTRTRSLTVNDGDDLTPLPINYKLALQVLEQTPTIVLNPIPTAAPPPPPSSSAASSKDTISSGNSLRRSKSVAVGGRSAVSRKSTNSVMMGGPPTHKHSTSVTNSRSSNERQFRSASEDIAVRHQSLSMASSSAAYSLQHKSTIKKKRWSHPDLPQKAEQRHNDKVDAMRAAAVQRPPQPVIEERPASTDSIDVDVDNYLNSPRLSQKIRHPQTGRVISFSEVGDPKGYAIFVCVGMGLTRYVMAFYDQLAATLKLRLITPDRPGIGGSQVDPNGTPLSWPDDVLVICQALKITKFSLLAHSAGAVYALATSLRMPQHIRGRVHLLAPWIPPSQMAPIGISQDQPPTQQLPRSQRFLRALPPSLLKVANSTFLSATSASLQRTGPKNSPKARRRSMAPNSPQTQNQQQRPTLKENRRESMMMMDQVIPNMNASSLSLAAANPSHPNHESAKNMKEALTLAERERQRAYDERLTFAIWDRATTNANPATDLIVCLETKQSIGFRYEDINRAVVIHHGSKDSRVPADNVRWLGRLMRKCEVRILEGEQHGLMASAQVMGNVLTEMASDWEDWTAVVKGDRTVSRRRTAERLRIPT